MTWEQRKFSEILKSHSFRAYLTEPRDAGNYEVIQQGDNPVVGYSDGEPFEKFEDVTLFGDHTVSLYKPTEPFFVATDGVKILSGDGFDGKYLFSLLERYKPESQGYKRHFTILKNKNVWFTKHKNEQHEIGVFFSNLDNLITLHQRKLEALENLKKTLLSKMFPKNGRAVPELRFAGFTDNWEQRKLGEVSERVSGNDGRMELPTLTISAGMGWLDQRERFSGNKAGKEQKNYTLLSENELSYNRGNSKLAKYGVVFKLSTHKEALVPRIYHSFRTTKEADPDYIEYMFATRLPNRELGKLVTSGARMDGLLNINYDDFIGIKIKIPSLAEQSEIGMLFIQLDKLITLHQRKIEQYQELKKTLLSKMFI
ncbi:restriction endonuclease subunit S [Globicatella sanguinis]|uniref:restriction endonuclease subunit S n=1 Tax=Globicatella sanguinis TaxID=13076 RepID=UPI0009F99AFA|nr:restriction endonuclease subunit S [Globicatella sanguinis]